MLSYNFVSGNGDLGFVTLGHIEWENGERAFRQCNYVDNEVDSALSLILKLKLMSEHDIPHPLAKVK